MTRPLGQLALLPILRARLAYPAVRLWESLSCLFVRCGWWCRHPGVRDRRLPRLLLAAVLLSVAAVAVWP